MKQSPINVIFSANLSQPEDCGVDGLVIVGYRLQHPIMIYGGETQIIARWV